MYLESNAWGYVSAQGTQTFTFPIAFTGIPWSIAMTKSSQSEEWGANYSGTVSKYTTTNCRVVSVEDAPNNTVKLICIGK